MTINLFGYKITLRKQTLIIIILFLVVLFMALGYLLVGNSTGVEYSGLQDSNADAAAEASRTLTVEDTLPTESASGNVQEIKVYVVGCVNKPGIVTLRKGQLVYDAVMAAGGLTKEADPQSINMVYPLDENSMLCIKPAAKDTSTQGQIVGAEIVKEGKGVVASSMSGNSDSGGKVNINTASEAELDTLPGIGQATAREIIAFREKNGSFKVITDIMKVPRIKEGRFENIKAFITVN